MMNRPLMRGLALRFEGRLFYRSLFFLEALSEVSSRGLVYSSI